MTFLAVSLLSVSVATAKKPPKKKAPVAAEPWSVTLSTYTDITGCKVEDDPSHAFIRVSNCKPKDKIMLLRAGKPVIQCTDLDQCLDFASSLNDGHRLRAK